MKNPNKCPEPSRTLTYKEVSSGTLSSAAPVKARDNFVAGFSMLTP